MATHGALQLRQGNVLGGAEGRYQLFSCTVVTARRSLAFLSSTDETNDFHDTGEYAGGQFVAQTLQKLDGSLEAGGLLLVFESRTHPPVVLGWNGV
ncbi:hypothetical protein EJ065_4217 [Corallococcus coralloides]|uniref:Uncharacterized protein n=1 Tax=Corallococcus coralloides TaxID=184914 RepID=A0A410RV21_CORCK|nr:hypothetical protein EJ065_4217 [Corallococcus coralloides]